MIHLHTRSQYSLLSSTLSITQIVQLAKQNQMDAIALTDEDVLYGAVAFFDACQKANIKPIIGLDKIIDEQALILLAKNDLGYQELMRISQQNLTFEEIDTTNLVVIFYPKATQFKKALIEENEQEIITVLSAYSSVKHFYVGITKTEHSLDIQYSAFLKRILEQLSIPAVALSYILYEKKEDAKILDLLNAIQLGYGLDDHRLPAYQNRHFRDVIAMKQLYSEDEIENTKIISNLCNVTFSFEKNSLPQYCENSKQFLKELCQKGLMKRLNGKVLPAYQKRLDYELSIILKMHFEDYFLITWDLVRFATQQNIYVGPGRGSAAGSLVAYCLGITKLDPLKYRLTFERFLNPERITMPDIDLDFPDHLREEVIQYVKEKYGEAHVCHIITFNTLKAKAALRDVGRVLKIDNEDIDKMIQRIKNDEDHLANIMKQHPEIKMLCEKNKKIQQLFFYASQIENFPRHISTHASGIVVSKKPVVCHAPIICVDGANTTQYSMHYLERFGLIKIDFLGLKNLSIISDTLRLIEQVHHKKVNILNIPLNDEKTFQLLQKGDTLGLFQLESEGMRQLLMKLKPNCLEDIALALALYRPGPMKHIPMFLEKRNTPVKITYYTEAVQPILAETLGIMIYQDQIMQVAQIMAGFSLGKADILRRAMSKKDASIFMELKEDFKQGCKNNGFDDELITQVFNDMESFAGYGFNKAHTISYALLAYQMAYLKANAPVLFYTSLLNSVIGNTSKTYFYLQEAKKNQIYVSQPHLLYSKEKYIIHQHQIYMPFTAIKNIGNVLSETLIQHRTHFATIYDFIVFALIHRISKKQIESLIHAGALDFFKMHRTMLLENLEMLLKYGSLVLTKDENGQYYAAYHLISQPELKVVPQQKIIEMKNEKASLGFYFSSHPITELRKKHYKTAYLHTLTLHRYETTIVMIDSMKKYHTKKKEEMCFLSVSDEISQMDFVLMPKQFAQYHHLLQMNQCYLVEVKKDKENSAIVQKMKLIT